MAFTSDVARVHCVLNRDNGSLNRHNNRTARFFGQVSHW